MNLLRTLAFAATALFAATFATAAPAKADNFGVYFGSDGFAVKISNYGGGHYGYGGYYGGYPGHYGSYDRCRDRWYRKRHRHCWNASYGGHRYYYGYGGYHPNYYYWPRPWRGNWGHHWRRNSDGWQRGHRAWGHHRGRGDHGWSHHRGGGHRGRH